MRGHGGSLGLPFGVRFLDVRNLIRPAFGLALNTGFLSRLSRPLGPCDFLSQGCRPSQTAHQPLSPFLGLVLSTGVGGVTLVPPPSPKGGLRRLPPTLCTPIDNTTAGCSKVPRGPSVPSGVCGLHTATVSSEGSGLGQWGAS